MDVHSTPTCSTGTIFQSTWVDEVSSSAVLHVADSAKCAAYSG